MLKRHVRRLRNDPEEMDIPYARATAFGDIVEADAFVRSPNPNLQEWVENK